MTRPGQPGATRHEAGVCHHAGPVPTTERLAGLEVTRPARTVVDLGRVLEQTSAVVAMDAALARGLDPASLIEELGACRHWPGAAPAARAVALTDGRSQSVGETLTRLACHAVGLPPDDLQLTVRTDRGTYEVDLAWTAQGVVGEFDGKVKYGRLLKPGESPSEVLVAERQRELAIERAGWIVVASPGRRCTTRLWVRLTPARRFSPVVPSSAEQSEASLLGRLFVREARWPSERGGDHVHGSAGRSGWGQASNRGPRWTRCSAAWATGRTTRRSTSTCGEGRAGVQRTHSAVRRRRLGGGRRPRRPWRRRRRRRGCAVQRELRGADHPGAISVTRTGVPTSSRRRVRARAPSACSGGRVPAAAGVHDLRRGRRHHHHVRRRRLAQERQQGAGDAQGAEHVHLVHLPPVVERGVGDGVGAQRAAGVVHQERDLTSQVTERRQQPGDGVVGRDVENHCGCRRHRRRARPAARHVGSGELRRASVRREPVARWPRRCRSRPR